MAHDHISQNRMKATSNRDSVSHLEKNIRSKNEKANALLATSYKGAWANGTTLIVEEVKKFLKINYKGGISANQDKANCLSTESFHSDMDLICVAQRGRAYRGEPPKLEPAPETGKTNCLTTVAKDNLILQRSRGANKGGFHANKSPTLSANAWEQNNLVVTMKDDSVKQLNPSRESNGTQPYQQNRVYDTDGLAPALMDGHGGRTINVLVGENAEAIRIRRLTPTECARLQTIPKWYKWNVSETQQYKMLGNGWTVEVIKHIFSFLPNELKK